MSSDSKNSRLSRWRAAAAVVVLASATAPAMSIEPFTADYEASYMGMQATGQMTLTEIGGERWRYSLDIENSLASLSQVTEFEEHNGTWRPLTGKDSSKVLVKNSDKIARYDWASGVANWTGDVKADRAGPIKLKTGDMDALLINLAIVRDLAAGKPLKYRLVDNGRTKHLHYVVAGEEQITVGGKPQQATKLVSSDGDKQTIAWVVDGFPVPARILQRENGKDAMDLKVRALK